MRKRVEEERRFASAFRVGRRLKPRHFAALLLAVAGATWLAARGDGKAVPPEAPPDLAQIEANLGHARRDVFLGFAPKPEPWVRGRLLMPRELTRRPRRPLALERSDSPAPPVAVAELASAPWGAAPRTAQDPAALLSGPRSELALPQSGPPEPFLAPQVVTYQSRTGPVPTPVASTQPKSVASTPPEPAPPAQPEFAALPPPTPVAPIQPRSGAPAQPVPGARIVPTPAAPTQPGSGAPAQPVPGARVVPTPAAPAEPARPERRVPARPTPTAPGRSARTPGELPAAVADPRSERPTTPVGAAGRPAPETTVPADPRLPATHPLIFQSSDEGVATMVPPERPDLPSPAAGPAFVVRDLLLGAGDRGPEKSQAAGPPVRLALGPPVTGLHRFGATDAVADTGSPSQPGRASPETLPALLAQAGPAVTPGPVQLAAAITPSRSPRLSTGVVLAPEPSTGLLVAAGLLAMAGHRRRQ